MKLFAFIGITIFILSGCGSGSNEENFLNSLSNTSLNANIELKGEINKRTDFLNNLEYFGELINTGSLPICSVGISIDSKDVSGSVLASDFAYVAGSTLLVDSEEEDTCLNPGEIGGFRVFTSIPSSDSLSIRIQWDAENISIPKVSSSQVVIDGPIRESTNILGNLSLSGSVKNRNSRHTIESVKVAFVGIKDDKVMDVAFTETLFGTSCNLNSTCIAPGDSSSFTGHMNIPKVEMDSYYYKINYRLR